MKSHPAIEKLEARIASPVTYFRALGANGRWFYRVSSASFALPGSGINIPIAVEDFLRRNGLETDHVHPVPRK